MRTTSRIASLVLAAALAGGLATGCTFKDKPSDQASNGASQPAPAAPTFVPASAEAAGEYIKFTQTSTPVKYSVELPKDAKEKADKVQTFVQGPVTWDIVVAPSPYQAKAKDEAAKLKDQKVVKAEDNADGYTLVMNKGDKDHYWHLINKDGKCYQIGLEYPSGQLDSYKAIIDHAEQTFKLL